MKKEKLINCLKLFLTFFKIGALTFGGGLAMIPFMERETAEKHHWIEKEDLLDIVTISESTPGPIAINAATFIGFKTAGTLGSVFATLGVVLPSFLIILLLSFCLDKVIEFKPVAYALWGIRAGVLALIAKSFWSLFKQTKKNVLAFVIMALAFVAVSIFKLDVIIIVASAAALGIAAYFISQKGGEKK
ncbi:MAG: chromate transporter [Ruminococcus sp.]|nr:chromate transporter [Ruminococcus sp.]MDO4419905.1 chromate transporter [Ruminococcus sp.]